MVLTLSYWPNQGHHWRASRTDPKPQLSDEQWHLIEDLFPVREMTQAGGRPPIPPRACLEGILLVLISGARWKDLPTHFPSPATCWRRLQEWTESGLLQQAWARLLHRLDALKSLRWDETMADGTFSPAKKGGACVGKTKRGKGTKIMLLVDGRGTPLGVDIASASPAEVQLIEPLLKQRILRRRPKRLIYDRVADSDPLRTRLAKRCIELICPHRRGRTRSPTQDGRPLRRYKRRWTIERTISWLFNYRRLVVRYGRHDFLFRGFIQLACAFTLLKRF